MENLDGFMGSIGVTILREGLKKDTTITLVVSCSVTAILLDLL